MNTPWRLLLPLSLLTSAMSTQVLANDANQSAAPFKLCPAHLYQPKYGVFAPDPNHQAGTIKISSDDIEVINNQSAEFVGNVQIKNRHMQLTASSALIDRQIGLLNANGPVVFQNQTSEVTSQGLMADLSQSEIALLGAEYRLVGQLGRGQADKLAIMENTLLLDDASYTTCPEGDEVWRIKADEIILSQEKGWGETYGMVLEVLDTPVIYLPYFTFPLDDTRKSGFVDPVFSSSSRYGLDIATPYYLNLAPNYDALVTPRLMTRVGLQMKGQFRYLTEQHQGMVAAELLTKDDTHPELDERYLIQWQQKSYLSENWRAYVDITNVSDDNYLTDLNSDYANETDTHLARTLAISHFGERFQTDIQVQNFEVLGDHKDSYTAFPQVAFSQHAPYQWGGLDWRMEGELSHFVNSDAVIDRASRLHLEPNVQFNLKDTAWAISSKFSLLHTRYQQEGDLNGTGFAEQVSRTMPSVRLHGKLEFERPTSIFIDDGIQTLEPQLQYLYTPKRDQSQIGLYDTTKLQDDFFGLFRERRFSSVDRIANANQFTLGATTRLYNQSNEEVFNLSVGQIFYLTDDAKPESQNVLADTASYNALFASEAMLHWHKRWYLSAGIQYDMEAKNLIQSHVTLDYKGDNNQLVQLNHRYADDVSGNEIEQVGLFASWPINARWQWVSSYHRDLAEKRSVEVFAGVQYESCCWALRLTGQRRIETDLTRPITGNDDAVFDSSIRLNFILKGLGGKKRYDVSRVLEQGIFGYRRPYFLNN